LHEQSESFFSGRGIEAVILAGQLTSALLVEEPFVVGDGAAGFEDGVDGDEVEGQTDSERGQLDDVDEVAEVYARDEVEPGDIAHGEHERTQQHQLPHGVVEQLRRGNGALTPGQQAVLVGPVHQEEPQKRGQHHVGLHGDIEAGEVETVHVVYVGVAQFELPQL
jgi:hypothetical protein